MTLPNDILSEISHSVISRLEAHKSVREVTLAERAPARIADIITWEHENQPLRLPADLRAFFMLSDGLELSWRVKCADETLPLGSMHLNAIGQLLPVTAPLLDHQGRQRAELPATRGGVRAFDLDSKCAHGRVCILYCGEEDKAQVWFQDLACSWNFIANSFTDYFRLMMLHLGLPRWHYAYTEVGLDPVARQWFCVLAPDRLVVALDTHAAPKRSAALGANGSSPGGCPSNTASQSSLHSAPASGAATAATAAPRETHAAAPPPAAPTPPSQPPRTISKSSSGTRRKSTGMGGGGSGTWSRSNR